MYNGNQFLLSCSVPEMPVFVLFVGCRYRSFCGQNEITSDAHTCYLEERTRLKYERRCCCKLKLVFDCAQFFRSLLKAIQEGDINSKQLLFQEQCDNELLRTHFVSDYHKCEKNQKLGLAVKHKFLICWVDIVLLLSKVIWVDSGNTNDSAWQ